MSDREWQQPALVFLGGGIGAGLRALLLTWLEPWGKEAPVLIVNLAGAFLLGVVFVLADEVGLLRARTRLFLAVGVLGGFTTFSTFGWGTDVLLGAGTALPALGYALASLAGGVVAITAGLQAGRAVVALFERDGDSARMRATRRDIDAIEAEDREESA